MIVVTLTALVINVGLFVKAKINLQNAVDAAAFSGAAVQARQLSSISYINWEMRNTYKEWMFKYYVLGNSGLRKLNGSNICLKKVLISKVLYEFFSLFCNQGLKVTTT